jgi:uncharacterized membrane protein YccF (DUF307 family)
LQEFHGEDAEEMVKKRTTLDDNKVIPIKIKTILGVLKLHCELFLVVVVDCNEVSTYPCCSKVYRISKVDLVPFDVTNMSDLIKKYTVGVKKLLQE